MEMIIDVDITMRGVGQDRDPGQGSPGLLTSRKEQKNRGVPEGPRTIAITRSQHLQKVADDRNSLRQHNAIQTLDGEIDLHERQILSTQR